MTEHEIYGGRLRLMRKQARVGLVSMAREMDLFPSYLHELECGEQTWTEDLQDDYREALERLAMKSL